MTKYTRESLSTDENTWRKAKLKGLKGPYKLQTPTPKGYILQIGVSLSIEASCSDAEVEIGPAEPYMFPSGAAQSAMPAKKESGSSHFRLTNGSPTSMP